jgi:hypothetical protein
MRLLEPRIMGIMTSEAVSTTDVIRLLYGDIDPERVRNQVHEALTGLERDGSIESRVSNEGRPVRYWALPGGTFPDGVHASPLSERVLDALDGGPMRIDALFEEVYTEPEKTDRVNAGKRLSKVLNRLRARGQVHRCRDPETGSLNPSTWERTKRRTRFNNCQNCFHWDEKRRICVIANKFDVEPGHCEEFVWANPEGRS